MSKFIEYIPVEIRELDGAEAPVVLTATIEGGREVEYREVDGQLLRPYTFPGMSMPCACDVAESLRDLEAYARQRDGDRIPWMLRPTRDDCSAHWASREGDWRQWSFDHRDQDIDTWRTFWSACAVIDGVLHVPSMGPAWTFRFNVKCNGASGESHLTPYVALVEEAGHISEREAKSFAPADVLAAEMHLDRNAWSMCNDFHGIPANSTTYLHGSKVSWSRVIDPRVGSVRGCCLPPPPQFPVSEALKAADWLMSALAQELGDMSPENIHRFADLKAMRMSVAEAEEDSVRTFFDAINEYRKAVDSRKLAWRSENPIRLIEQWIRDHGRADGVDRPIAAETIPVVA